MSTAADKLVPLSTRHEKVVARLEPEIGFAERNKVFHSRPANLQAWDCYHLGVYHFSLSPGPTTWKPSARYDKASSSTRILAKPTPGGLMP